MIETTKQDYAIATMYESYRPITRPGYQGHVLESGGDAIEAALTDPTACTPLDAGGRDAVYRFQANDGDGIVRVYRRGGTIRHILKETYFFDNRPRKEFEVHHYALEQGLPVPPLLGVAWHQIGPAFRGSIATGYLQSDHLQHWLEQHSEPDATRLNEVGKVIKKMHDAGISHADLQVRNILMTSDEVYLIDFDSAFIHNSLAEKVRLRNLLRLKRSFIKNNLPLVAFDHICTGYGVDRFPKWMEWLQRAGDDRAS